MPPRRSSTFSKIISSCIPKPQSRSRYTLSQKAQTYPSNTNPSSNMSTTQGHPPGACEKRQSNKEDIQNKFKKVFVRAGTFKMPNMGRTEKDKSSNEGTSPGSGSLIAKAFESAIMTGVMPLTPNMEPVLAPSSSRPNTSSGRPVPSGNDYFYGSVPSVPPLPVSARSRIPATPPQTPPASQPRNLQLKDFDIQFLIDDSGSMRGLTSSGRTHWEEVKDVLSKMVPKCASTDNNGVDVFFLNSILVNQFNGLKIKNPESVMWLFEERRKDGIRGSTPTAEALDLILAPYLRECESNRNNLPPPRNIIVITDGAANNNNLLQENLVAYAKRLDKIQAPQHQIKVQFFQVGNVKGVEESFKELNEAKSIVRSARDIVYTKSTNELGGGLTAETVIGYVEQGINAKSQR